MALFSEIWKSFLISNEFRRCVVTLASITDAFGSIFHHEIRPFLTQVLINLCAAIQAGGTPTFSMLKSGPIGNFFQDSERSNQPQDRQAHFGTFLKSFRELVF